MEKYALVGIPDHEGVVNVGGRIGACYGPKAFRKFFSKLSKLDAALHFVRDLGDVTPIQKSIEANHVLAIQKIKEAHLSHDRSIVVGGGHDHGWSHLKGIFEALKLKAPKRDFRLGCINIDAHLDVRKPEPAITSGSPFYLSIEEKIIRPKNLIEFGIQKHCNSQALWGYVDKHQVPVILFEKLRGGKAVSQFKKSLKALQRRCDAIVISFDLDAFSQAFAPGVSAPQAEGFTPSEGIEMVTLASQNKKVVSLGIFELNPEHDISEMTARLAATLAYHFIATDL